MGDLMEFSVPISYDEEGYIGRECPSCFKYFKIKPGTGIPDSSDCYCPYCKHFASQDEFWTKAQIEYAQSVALNKITSDLLNRMKKLERKPNRNQFVSIGITVKGSPTPITYYSEKDLEETVICKNCTLDFTIYGTFGFCPDCGTHNSEQIIFANFDLALKIMRLASIAEIEIKNKLIENSLEDCISAFDGFAREHCSSLYAKISFQNIKSAQTKLLNEYGIDISTGLSNTQWAFVIEQFQKRHLLAHKMGIIDEEFVLKTNANQDNIGKKVIITETDVTNLIESLKIVVNNIVMKVKH